MGQDGEVITLSVQQIQLLEALAKMKDLATITDQQQELLKNITYDDLNQMDTQQINEILNQNGIQVPYVSDLVDRTNKRVYAHNMHYNSDEYKNLGYLHRERRVINYFP